MLFFIFLTFLFVLISFGLNYLIRFIRGGVRQIACAPSALVLAVIYVYIV